MSLRTSDVSVSKKANSFSQHLFTFILVDKPQMVPRKDYDDYTTFINDTFNEKKVAMLRNFSEKAGNKKESRTVSSNPYMSETNEVWLKRMATTRQAGNRNMHLRNMSQRITTPQN